MQKCGHVEWCNDDKYFADNARCRGTRKPAFVRVSWNSRARAFRVGVENLINRERSTSLQYLTIGAFFNFAFRVPPSLSFSYPRTISLLHSPSNFYFYEKMKSFMRGKLCASIKVVHFFFLKKLNEYQIDDDNVFIFLRYRFFKIRSK